MLGTSETFPYARCMKAAIYGGHAEGWLVAMPLKLRRESHFVEMAAVNGVRFSSASLLACGPSWRKRLIEAGPRRASESNGRGPRANVPLCVAVSADPAARKLDCHVVEDYESRLSPAVAGRTHALVERLMGRRG